MIRVNKYHKSSVLAGMYELQAQILHMLQSVDVEGKKEIYKKIDSMDIKNIAENLLKVKV